MLNLKLLEECNKCDRSENRYRVVEPSFVGEATYFFIADHPSFEEELMNEPFAGIRKDYLRKVLDALGILNKSYFTNSVKCGLNPTKKAERKACSLWFEQERDMYKPRRIFSFEKYLKKTYGDIVELPALGRMLASQAVEKKAKKIIMENL